ncbi:hypothetical protein IG616_18655 [Labrenzia suaedae]|uniref:Uncharacterized protein n=1 Tax=Roseibium litorale TaxID=2803841 RepID=A0ABR9CRS8_9HYPH|nr:hypothetical protein [Roseibium litorale]
MIEKVVDPLEAVMGEDWGILKIPASMRGPMLQYVLELQKKIAGGGGGGSGSSSWTDRMTTAFLAQKPQAMAKLIRTGGTSDLRGIRDQMDYLRKEGSVELERSDRYFGFVVDQAAEAEMMTSWQLADAGDGKADRTSHFRSAFRKALTIVRLTALAGPGPRRCSPAANTAITSTISQRFTRTGRILTCISL